MKMLRSGGALFLVAALLAPPVAAQVPGRSEAAQRAFEAYRTGEYERARELYRDYLDENPGSVEARIGLMEELVATGDYEEAIEVGRSAPNPAAVANATGEALLEVGRLDDAEAAFTTAMANRDELSLTAEVNLAELYFERGAIADAMRRFDRFIDVYNAADGNLGPRDLVAVGRAVQYLGRTESNLFQDALRAFDEAANAAPGWYEPRVRIGDLFLSKYDSPSAQAEYDAVLSENPRHPGALLGKIQALHFDGSSEAQDYINRLLEVNPNHVQARALLAGEQLATDGHEAAREQIEQALAVNPNSLEALTVLAGSHMLADETSEFEAVRQRIHAINPRYAGLGEQLAELAVRVRRYDLAVARAQEAVDLDPEAWEAWGLLGMNQLRLGDIEVGRENLERAFAGDPFNPWFKNSLDLLDTFERYEIHSSEHFDLFLNRDEGDLLALYLEPIAEEAYDSLSRRYGVEPDLPVRAELFVSSADFSVRTLGEAGLGALGVSFGRVLVMDSPTARQLGEYNWASVFWHELSHTFHLAATEGRVPRWFSEGLAVHEQRKARPYWGHQPTIPFLQALQQNRLKPVSELDDGFMRPEYPQQVVFSYYESSLVFQVIEERYGFDAILGMLMGYDRGASTEQLFESELGVSLEEFDEEFEQYLRDRFRRPLRALVEVGERPMRAAGLQAYESFVRSHPGDFIGRIQLGALLMAEERYDEAEEHLQEAVRMFPEYGQPDSPYWFLAQIHREQGELDRAAAALARLNALSESNYAALLAEADVLEELGDLEGAAAALDKAVLVWPYDIDVHDRLATMKSETGDYASAVRERSAIVALGPPDRAEAYYRLALAQRDAGDPAGARRSVLRALEVAPNYGSALELLLEVRESN